MSELNWDITPEKQENICWFSITFERLEILELMFQKDYFVEK